MTRTSSQDSRPCRVAVLFGTRPEAVKLAPVLAEIGKHGETLAARVIVTAQHRQMLDQVLKLFSIVPHHDLNVMRPNQDLFQITSRMLEGLGPILREEAPDLLLVQGDTTTVFVGALASYYLRIPVGHVEAGLRTGDKFSPYPEELNRKLTGALTDLHFAPTEVSRQNLLREGVLDSSIFVTGNPVIDALLATVREDYTFQETQLARACASGRVVLVTAHRRESFGKPFRGICQGLRRIADVADDIQVVYPVHLNPNIREPARELLGGHERIHLLDPLDYEPFVQLMARSTLILTDSGGVQEEAPSLGKPVLVLRDTTERPEGLEAGTVRLVGTDPDRIHGEASRLLTDAGAHQAMARAVNPYGDGRASELIVKAILDWWGSGNRPTPR